MSKLTLLVKKYLKQDNVTSLLQSYTPTERDNVLPSLKMGFYDILTSTILPQHFGTSVNQVPIIGQGTQGVVCAFVSDKVAIGIREMQNRNAYMRKVQANLQIFPKALCVKMQVFHRKSSYWEARAMREEIIMNKINDLNVKELKDAIPRFYFGCTIAMPYGKDTIKCRITFMDLITSDYITILEWAMKKKPLPDGVIEKIKELVTLLWNNGISHNDLSVNNILVKDDPVDIKLIDFGLSEMLNQTINSQDAYNNYFANLDRSEQNGSNVTKLQELKQFIDNLRRP